MRITALIARTALLPAACVLALAASPLHVADTPVYPELAAFADQLRTCAPATAPQPHPFMKSFTIEHAITGVREGRCDYSQTMPGGMRMVCAFDDASRDAYADELERTAKTGAMSGSSKGPQPTWNKACEIETKDGKRMPMGG